MDTISKTKLLDLIDRCEGLAISIYMPTHESGQEVEQNSIQFKNFLNQAENQLSEAGKGEGQVNSYLKPLHELLKDELFWQQQANGLSVLLDANETHIFRLHDRVEELMIIGDCFHISTLIPFYQGNGSYFLLAIDQERPRIFKGSKFDFDKIDDLDLPESLQEMFDQFYEFHSHLTFHTKTSTPNPDIPAQRSGMFFNQGGGDDIDEEAELINFFHRFDRALMDYIGGEDAPLVLAGAGFLHHPYRQANTYPYLVDEGITKNVEQMPIEELHKLSWQIVKNQYENDVEQALSVYQQMVAKNKESAQGIEEIVPAAYYKRVHTLFIPENRHVWGNFDPQNNQVHIEEAASMNNEDLINFAAVHTLMNGGKVFVLPVDKMPDSSVVAAILRY